MTTDKLIPEAEMQQMTQDAARVPAAQRIENFEQDGAQVASPKAFHRLIGNLCVVIGLDYAFGAENKQGLSTVLVGSNAVEANAYSPFALARPDANMPTGLGRIALNRALDYLSDFNQHNDGALVLCNADDLRQVTDEAISAAVDRLNNVFEGVAVSGNLSDENVTRADLLRFDYRLRFDPRMDDIDAAGTFKHEVTLFLVVNCPNLYNSDTPAKLIRQVQNSIQSATTKAGIESEFALLLPSPAALTSDLFPRLAEEYGFTAESGQKYILQPVALRDVERRDLNREWLPADVSDFFGDNDLLLVADEADDLGDDEDMNEDPKAVPAVRSPVKSVNVDDEDDDLLDDEQTADVEENEDDELLDDEEAEEGDDEDRADVDEDDIDAEDETGDEDDGEEEEATVQFNVGMYVASVDLMRDMAQQETGEDKEKAKAEYLTTRNDFIAYLKTNVRELYGMRNLFDGTARDLLKALHRAEDDKAVTAAGVAFVKHILGDEAIVQNMCSADDEFAAGYDAIMSDDGEDDQD